MVKAFQTFVRNELTPLLERLNEINNWLGEEVIASRPYSLEAAVQTEEVTPVYAGVSYLPNQRPACADSTNRRIVSGSFGMVKSSGK